MFFRYEIFFYRFEATFPVKKQEEMALKRGNCVAVSLLLIL